MAQANRPKFIVTGKLVSHFQTHLQSCKTVGQALREKCWHFKTNIERNTHVVLWQNKNARLPCVQDLVLLT